MPVEISLVSEKVPRVEDEDDHETDEANLQLVSPGDVITRFELLISQTWLNHFNSDGQNLPLFINLMIIFTTVFFKYRFKSQAVYTYISF